MKFRTLCTALIGGAFLLAACGDDEDTSLRFVSEMSECGGFADQRGGTDDAHYCAAEHLQWTYDAATGELVLLDARANLNCCGVHGISASWLDRNRRGLEVQETDEPLDGSRCRCTCVFDFRVRVQEVSGSSLHLRLVRNVTDQPGGATVLFDGTLDLGQGQGSIVLDDTDLGPDCRQTGQ